jgi:hypothetical protein
METIDIDTILERNAIKQQIYDYLDNFDTNTKHGIYIYGDTSIGKTRFIKNTIKEKYTMIYLDSLDLRNRNRIEEFKGSEMSKETIFSSFNKIKRNIVIVLDDIETMNNGDKGGINSLVQLLKNSITNNKNKKKNKKKKYIEDCLINPIICINNYFSDKKISDLKKSLITIEMNKPTNVQIQKICEKLFIGMHKRDMEMLVENIGGNLNRVKIHLDNYKIFGKFIPLNTYNKNKTFYKVTEISLTKKINIKDYTSIIKETDKTSISLLFHENVIDILTRDDIELYLEILKNMCFGDYVDRQIFQHQLWEFNDISFIIKLIFNNNLLLNNKKNTKQLVNLKNIRFTKVLTKYSSEYSNNNFINKMCQMFTIDKNDLYLLFNVVKENKTNEEIYNYFNDTELKPLEVKRFYKFLDLEL